MINSFGFTDRLTNKYYTMTRHNMLIQIDLETFEIMKMNLL